MICEQCRWRKTPIEHRATPYGNPNGPIAVVSERLTMGEVEAGGILKDKRNSMIWKALDFYGADLKEYYFTVAHKCRISGDNLPSRGDFMTCAPNIREELKGFKVIITLGQGPFYALTGIQRHMNLYEGKAFELDMGYGTQYIVPTYHPSNYGRRYDVNEDSKDLKIGRVIDLAEGIKRGVVVPTEKITLTNQVMYLEDWNGKVTA